MPVFPRYESKGQLTTQQPSVQAVQDNTGQVVAEAGANIGNAISQNAVRWSNAVDTIQKTTAQANFKAGMLDIENRAAVDPDYNNSDKYFKEIEKLRTDNLKGFASKTAETEAAIEFGYESKVGQAKIQNLYRKKMVDVGQMNALKLIDAELSNPTDNSKANIEKVINAQVEAGIFDHKTGYDLYNKSVKNLVEFDVANDNATEEHQSQVLAELKKGENGKYADVPGDVRLDLIKASQQRIFNNNQTYKRDIADSQNIRSNALIDKFAAGEATIRDIEAEESIPEESGGIKREQLYTYKKAILSGIKGNLDRMLREKTPNNDETRRARDVRKYLDLIDNFIDNKVDQWKAKEMLAQAYGDGIINDKEQKFLNDMKQNLKDIEFNRSTSIVASTIRGVKDFLNFQSNASDEDIARNIKTLVGEIAEGKDPNASARKVISQEIVKRIPDISTYPETGKIKRDANGNKIRVFPDGTYEEVEATEST